MISLDGIYIKTNKSQYTHNTCERGYLGRRPFFCLKVYQEMFFLKQNKFTEDM